MPAIQKAAHTLNAALHAVLPESRIFRIDHYLGTELIAKRSLMITIALLDNEQIKHSNRSEVG